MSTSTYKVNPVVMDDECTLASIPKKDSAIPYTPTHMRSDSISPVKVYAKPTDDFYYVPNEPEATDIFIPKESATKTVTEIAIEPMDTSIPQESATETAIEPMDTSIPDEPISDEETADNTCNESQFVEVNSANDYCDRPVYEEDSDRDCP